MTEQKMSPEVLIYIQNIRKYLDTHDDMKEYFALDSDSEMFFKILGEMSQDNFTKNGDPGLTIEQYEEIKKKLPSFTKGSLDVKGTFINIGNFGLISLN